MEKPNILFIFTDDQRFDTISALGNSQIETPNMDRLVAKGTTFTHAHIMGGTSGAVCMPSRAMMLTGRTLFSIEEQGQRIPPGHTAMPEWLRENGYVSSHVGKWHQDRDSFMRCFQTGARIWGFNYKKLAGMKGWYEACNGHWHVPVHDYDPAGAYHPDSCYNVPPIESYRAPFEKVKDRGTHSVEIFSDAAIDFMRRHKGSAEHRAGNPFFLYLAHLAPHDPRQYPSRFLERYTADKVTLPSNFATRHPFDNGELLVRDELLEALPRHPEAIRQHIADYYALIAFIDEELGKIFKYMEKTGLDKNTIIVFSSDNGLAVGQHGLMGKQNLYDHSIRVPLVFAGPGIPENQKTDAFCYLLDIFPTLCELTGISTPETVEGHSLVPVMREPAGVIRDSLHFAYKGVQRAVRKGKYKMIEYAVNGKRTTQVFDLQKDPLETDDISDASENVDIRKALRLELERWRTDLADTQDMGNQFWNVH